MKARPLAALGLALLLALPALPAEKEKVSLQQFIRELPTRVTDADRNPGDMVNLVLVGTRAQVEEALAAAGWVQVDRTVSDAAVRAIINILQKKVYLEMPMSELFLFDRPQDYGFAHAEPVSVIAERHHFRLWESPWLTADGRSIWVGAGTHDIGFEEDQRNGDVTHKIDPDVDKEREFIAATLKETGKVAGVAYLRLPQPVTEANTVTGGSYHSDGRVVVVILK